MRLSSLLALLVCITPALHAQQEGCSETRQVGGYTVELRGVTEKDSGGFENHQCRARVTARDRSLLLEEAATYLHLLDVSGKDITGDGSPDLVLQRAWGDSLCSFDYVILSLGDPPQVLLRLGGQCAYDFSEADGDGRIAIQTADSAFTSFDQLFHYESPLPPVYLRLQGAVLHDVSAEFWPRYEKEIEAARLELTPDRRRALREAQSPYESTETRAAVSHALFVVLAYLNGGRDDDAWKALEELWPPGDFQRIRALIIQTRASGVLRCLGVRQCVNNEE